MGGVALNPTERGPDAASVIPPTGGPAGPAPAETPATPTVPRPSAPGAPVAAPPAGAPAQPATGTAAPGVAPPLDLALFGVAIAARGRPGRTGAEEAAWTVLHLGAADDEHGRASAIDLLAALRHSGQPARLRLVGALPQAQRGRLLERATAAGVVGALDLVGARAPHEIARLLVEAALLVVPAPPAAPRRGARGAGSTPDGGGLVAVVLAGCAAGTPVLAPDLPETRPLAAELPEVTLMAPRAPVETWARAAASPLPVPPTPDERWTALRRLRRSSFCQDRPALGDESAAGPARG
ncbi:glycosyltransferase [Frankia sp. AgB1.9]|uniref:glycosyltransferase n=1 Tax=unclassified Frankia TaxID=2632575 RepID=UPI001932443E|nr:MULTISPECIES: glycosyltransferase [unclassified Frankia]MBL7491013.1 glycosyltransferase [Frankia sp. AgW1.1]MBL7552370.1 glycosyltransferase [Frankia sp. AgB1.9]MBL7622131.1 glycosyltransferase [Frankia sp. AgB1.8]